MLTSGQAGGQGTLFLGQEAPGASAHLRDDAGADTYVANTSRSIHADPSLAEPVGGELLSSVQASVERNALALLRDAGEGVDSFTAVPADPACAGERGGDAWTDCGSLHGEGDNRS